MATESLIVAVYYSAVSMVVVEVICVERNGAMVADLLRPTDAVQGWMND